MWHTEPTTQWQKDAKYYEKKHHNELAAVLRNLKRYVALLEVAPNCKSVQAGFLHHEPKGVIAIDQKGGGGNLQETRLYTYADEARKVLYLITIGNKNEQPDDIQLSKTFVESIQPPPTPHHNKRSNTLKKEPPPLMSTEHRKDAATKPSGRRYSSVDELLKGEGIAPEVQAKVSEIEAATKVVEQLSLLRQMAGLTQEQMAQHLGFSSQSAVSKLESGLDEEVTIGQIRKYVEISGQRVGMLFGKPFNHVEAVKAHASGMKKHLSALACLAHKGDDLKTEIQAFFGEAFFNILTILSQCQSEMPEEKPTEVRLEVLGKPSSVSRSINRPAQHAQMSSAA